MNKTGFHIEELFVNLSSFKTPTNRQEAGMNTIRDSRRVVTKDDFYNAFEKFIRKLREGRPAAAVYC